MADFLLDALSALSGAEFEEKPVDLETFVTDDQYLDLPPLSQIQYTCIKAITQIYRLETLEALFGKDKAAEIFKTTCNEIILMLGKGSGKDFMSTIACAYIVYLLLCLKDPARYYGKPKNDAIDILNIAINAQQAQNVFFKGFKQRIEDSEWFQGKYYVKAGAIEFDKNITVHSGHSERESWEGYNTFMVILDEISGFALESPSGGETSKTASAVYDMYRASVTSRFAEFGKLVLLSFPRFNGDFISQRYEAEVAEKEVIQKEHTLYRDPNLPEGTPNNEFVVKWDHEIITRYVNPKVFAIKRTTWEVNPIKKPEDYTRDFFDNPGDTYGRVACMPSTLESGFFKNHEKIENAFSIQNGVDEDGVFLDKFRPKADTKYYIHVDLAQKHDYCAVAIAHVDDWVQVGTGANNYTEILPLVVVDAIRWWKPTKDKSIDFKDVTDYILALRRRGFKIGLATFDRWNSHDTMNYLEGQGIDTGTLSVANKHYDDFLSVMYDDRLVGPKVEILTDELKELRMIKGKIDHPRKGTKDLSDASCGAIFNAVSHTERPRNRVVEASTLTDLRKKDRLEYQAEATRVRDGVIRPPKASERPDYEDMPPSLADYLKNMKLL